jgi:valyl-tRNA synthetase
VRPPAPTTGSLSERSGPTSAALLVDTTRPELLAACVAVVVHPDDDRYADLIGTTATTPLFSIDVPILAHRTADPTIGTGAVMVCTFGDATDVEWWRDLDLPTRPIVGPDGRLRPVDFSAPGWDSGDPPAAVAAYDELAGLSTAEARQRIAALLAEWGGLVGDPRPISHPVRYWENGSRPLEILTVPQWFIDVRKEIPTWRAHGERLQWKPPHMHQRYRDWVDGLAADWNISRQRYFGVPVPVWYPIRDDGSVDAHAAILPAEDRLPIDPATDTPDGYRPDQRDQPGGFTDDPDVMDTWATSSLTPQIAGGWPDDPDLFDRVFPYDLRPQAHDIIRTWLFTTIVRSHYHHGQLPWREAAISGFVVDPDRRKLSKSKTSSDDDPNELLDRYGADALRYWAAGASLGADTTLDLNRITIGRRLATKLLHVSRFVLLARERHAGPVTGATTHPADRAWLARLATVIEQATQALEDHDHAGALRTIETAFWSFCDDIVELIKPRAYGDLGPTGAAAAVATLTTTLKIFQRLLAPYLPYVTEETWSWWHSTTIHRAPWPTTDALDREPNEAGLDAAIATLTAVRRAKSDAQTSMRDPVHRLTIATDAATLAAIRPFQTDLAAYRLGRSRGRARAT